MTKAVHFQTADGARYLGRREDDTVIRAAEAPAAGFVPTEENWAVIEGASGRSYPLAEVRLLAPVAPSKIIAIGLNYQSHVTETSLARPDVPFMFPKLPSSVIGPHEEIVIPREETRPDYEGELAIVIAKRAYRVTREQAWSHVGGYTVVNDVSGRRAQLETPMKQFSLGKSFDTFTPMGDGIVAPDSLPDKTGLDIRTTVSGELMQDGNTRSLIFGIPELLEYFTRGVTLYPGDVIATGTPGGVGDERKPPRYLRDGDLVEIEIPGVGKLANPVRFEA
ncbi:fumarylacetoacetate hydrolase family protein [Sciscionella marina]|uniref:fumarylacetoacetate hydrolase family protein n=1 Tax=Sciscionella marina TaxID=508770 RepID=UPI00036C8924|nr:fumarylacetoacetate hydrolase family protein [Sciscionella marina]